MSTAATFEVERALLSNGARLLAGVDEVGRGALAGPVSVGAVLIDVGCGPPPVGLKDSKLLSAAARARLLEPIGSWALAVAVGHASAQEIDTIGIMAALALAAGRALAGLGAVPDTVILDGTVNFLSPPRDLFEATGSGAVINPRVITRVRADRDCASVSAASIVAKVTRDALMVDMSAAHPQYGWDRNKGYGTADHTAALAEFGACDAHRRSWRLPTTTSAGHNGSNDGSATP